MPTSKISQLGLTYDDVLLIPDASDVSPRDVDVTTYLSRGIKLNVPIVSAAMDTITESQMAMAMAREGGIGILHKNLSTTQQIEMVDLVKRSESGMILDPLTQKATDTVKDARALVQKYKIGGIPIVDDKNKLKGIVTNRDLRFEQNPAIRLSEIMTSEHLVTAPMGTTLEQ